MLLRRFTLTVRNSPNSQTAFGSGSGYGTGSDGTAVYRITSRIGCSVRAFAEKAAGPASSSGPAAAVSTTPDSPVGAAAAAVATAATAAAAAAAAARSVDPPAPARPMPVKVAKAGIDLLLDPIYNKGNAFSASERDRFELRGLLPQYQSNLEAQILRSKQRLDRETDPMTKAILLNALQDRNETLFYGLLVRYIKELAPIVYTPTVGQVCLRYGLNYRRPRGMYFSPQDFQDGEISSMVYNWPSQEVDVAVVTDGSRILGLGDLGLNGMPIPIGKLSLYVAAAGIHPARTLPIMLDVGTNNKELLADPLYQGLKQPRLAGAPLQEMVGELLRSLRGRWPNILVQFEDFDNSSAYPILHRFRHDHLVFNDDIQGTGAVALAGIFSALRLQRKPRTAIGEQRVVCLGAGSAGLGVVYSLFHGMVAQGRLSADQAAANFWLVDKDGLLTKARGARLAPGQDRFARDPAGQPADAAAGLQEGMSLLETVRRVRPTILLGLSGVGRTFQESVVREMSKHTERPIIFPLSNPTDRAECSFAEAVEWTDGRVIFASGSPFQPHRWRQTLYYPSQGNNLFIYPGVGLGAVISQAQRISLSMFSLASSVLADCVGDEELARGQCYPNVENIRMVSRRVAAAVARMATESGLARNPLPAELLQQPLESGAAAAAAAAASSSALDQYVRSRMYEPSYSPFVRWDFTDELSQKLSGSNASSRSAL